MESSRPIPYARMFALARPEWRRLLIATVALIIASGMSLAYPQAVRWMVDAVLESGDLGALNKAAAVLVALFFVQSVFVALRAWLFTVASERIVANLRQNLFESILSQDMAFFDRSRTGELTSRLSADTAILQNTVTVNVSMALRFSLGAIGGIVLLLWTSPMLTGIALATVPFAAAGSSLYGRTLRRFSQRVQDTLAVSTAVAEEAIGGVRTVRAFAREPEEVLRYGRAVDESFQLAAKRAVAIGAFHGVGGFVGYCVIALVVWVGGRLVLDGRMSIGDLTAFLLYTGLVGVSIGALAGLYSDFMRAVGASERVFELLEKRPTLERVGGEVLAEVRGAIAFDKVEFAYPSRPDVPVLRGFDLVVAPGEIVALVGPSGAGKSTVASLLLRLYDPQSGRVAVDGRDVRGIDPRSLRAHIGLVSQEPVLFATSIAENIRYGRPDAREEEVRAAARAANAEEFILGFPQGYETLVGERGVQLSGGQKQRVAIARALLKDPPILVLDEATSALDAESEHLVQDALERLMRGRTTVVIAHRLSTVRAAHRVAVVDQGQVVEQGTHRELVMRDGLYRRLVQRQFAAADGMEALRP